MSRQKPPSGDRHTLSVFMRERVSPSTKSQASKSDCVEAILGKGSPPRTQQEQLSRAATALILHPWCQYFLRLLVTTWSCVSIPHEGLA